MAYCNRRAGRHIVLKRYSEAKLDMKPTQGGIIVFMLLTSKLQRLKFLIALELYCKIKINKINNKAVSAEIPIICIGLQIICSLDQILF